MDAMAGVAHLARSRAACAAWLLASCAPRSQVASIASAPLTVPAVTAAAPSATAVVSTSADASGFGAPSSAPLVASVTPPTPSEGPIEPTPIDVPQDKRVYVVFGDRSTDRVFVYLHGKCGDPLAFRSFARVIHAFGTFVSFEGDVKCDGGRTKWGDDTGLLDARVSKALDAVEAARGAPLDKEHLVAVGYSAGALRAEALATKFPERYARVVLIAGPRAPRAGSLEKTAAILLMGGEYDIYIPLLEAADDLKKHGRPARFIQIPAARHGDYGPKAEETMEDALRWVVDDHG